MCMTAEQSVCPWTEREQRVKWTFQEKEEQKFNTVDRISVESKAVT